MNIENETETLGTWKVERFIISGKLIENRIEEDLEVLHENEVDLQK